MDIATIELGTTMLLKSKCEYGSDITEETLVFVSEKAYKLASEDSYGSGKTETKWILKESFNNEYEILEIL